MLGDFTTQAEAYAQARPGYPEALMDRLCARAGVRAGDPVADLGAGTGLLTQSLVARGLQVTAIEPNEPMRRMAVSLPGVTWQAGTFEDTGLADHSQAWVIAAQAFHWAEPPRALPEIRRVLRPSGHFTVLWNERQNDRSPVLGWTRAAIRRQVPEFDEAYRDIDWAAVLISTGDFTDVRYDRADHVVLMSPERYLNLWRSHNRLNAFAGPERFASFLAELQDYLTAERLDQIEVPYCCQAWTVRAATCSQDGLPIRPMVR